MTPKLTRDNVIIGFGLFCLLTGGLFSMFWPAIMDYIISQILVLSKTSKSYNEWKSTSMPMSLKFYLWNWTNPEGLRSPNYKAKFVEVGPYTYRERAEKVNVTWNSNGTVTYKRVKRWYYDEENSVGSLDQKITTLNVVALTSTHLTRYWSSWMRYSLSGAISVLQDIYVTKTVDELLFAGYDDPLISIARSIPGLAQVQVPYDRFGWFYKRNDSADFDGVFNMETGVNNIDDLGVIRKWNYNNYTTFYRGECGSVQGSAGEFWPPKRTKQTNVELFSPDLCRYVTLFYSEEDEIDGITSYKYRSDERTMDNGTIYSPNSCFCEDKCVFSGVLNVSSCKFGSPAFASFPHFYLADSYYTDAIDGMKPDKEKHNLYISLEPFTGIALEVAARIQINLLLQSDDTISLFKDVPTIFFPILWFEQKVTLPEEYTSEVKRLLRVSSVGNVAAIVLAVVGALSAVSTIIFRHFRKVKSTSLSKSSVDKQIIPNGIEDDTSLMLNTSQKKYQVRRAESNNLISS